MLDIKAWNAKEHREVTGEDNRTVLENALFLAERGKLCEVRTVVVPGLFDAQETVRETCRLLAPYQAAGPIRLKLIAYRENGVRRQYRIYHPPVLRQMEELAETARKEGFLDIITT